MNPGALQNASWLVTDRSAGASQGAFASNNLARHVGDDPAAVAANRQRLDEILGVSVVFATAAHVAQVGVVSEPGADVPGVDALITNRRDLAVAAQGADCVMLGISCGDWVAAVHCGWRGLVAGIVPATLRALAAAGADPASAGAHLGPCICPACYPVDQTRADEVRTVCPAAVAATSAGGAAIDLRAGVLAQLAAAGITATSDPRCTAEDPALYSYRRDGVTGRQALVIRRSA